MSCCTIEKNIHGESMMLPQFESDIQTIPSMRDYGFEAVVRHANRRLYMLDNYAIFHA